MREAETSSKARFDAFAHNYDELHQEFTAKSGEDSEYFTLYKLECLKRLGAVGPVMDYGCGIGNLTTHLASAFGDAHGFDPSQASVDVARAQTPGARFWSEIESAPSDFFGTVVLSCVLHHIPPNERAATLKSALRLLKPGGRLVVFEHNPLNPVTRKIVRECAFDEDAILLWPRELRRRLRDAGFEQVALSYIVFFPRFLAKLRPLEPQLSWLCAGAQTMTVGTRAR